MTVSKVGVSHSISLNIRITRWLKERTPDVVKRRRGVADDEFLIFTTARINQKFLWWKYIRNYRFFIAVIFINDSVRSAVLSRNWVIDVYGSEYLEQISTLATDLSLEFRVHVHVVLRGENPLRVKSGDESGLY